MIPLHNLLPSSEENQSYFEKEFGRLKKSTSLNFKKEKMSTFS
jgi:hypothetical protein